MFLGSLFWVFEKIHKAAEEEVANVAESITQELTELYRMLEAGKISEAEFNIQEGELLDRLDEIQERDSRTGEEDEEDDEDDE